jgi:hypothetical protein
MYLVLLFVRTLRYLRVYIVSVVVAVLGWIPGCAILVLVTVVSLSIIIVPHVIIIVVHVVHIINYVIVIHVIVVHVVVQAGVVAVIIAGHLLIPVPEHVTVCSVIWV